MLFSTVIHTLREYQIDPHTDKLVIGVSGGVDSMVLLSVLHKMNFDLVVVHVNYHKRGVESDKDQELVLRTSEEWGYPCIVESVYPDEVTGNFQKWARTVRYDRFEQVRKEHNAKAIAVAHHLDDQIETILQKMMRGAGMESWQGMSVLEDNILRPLLSVSRKDIKEFAALHHISYRDDASNFESNFARNFLRNEWIPRMNELMPGWQTNIANIPQKAALFEESVDVIIRNLEKEDGRIKRQSLLELSHDLQKSIINRIVKKKFGIKRSPAAPALENLTNLSRLQTGAFLELGNQLVLQRDRDVFVLKDQSKDQHLPELLFEKDDLDEKTVPFEHLQFSYTDCTVREYEGALYINVSDKDWPVRVRKWNYGDRIQPLGMQGHKKISDLLTDKKIDASAKNDARVIVSFEETICAVIFPQFKNSEIGSISEQYKCGDATEKALIIQKIS